MKEQAIFTTTDLQSAWAGKVVYGKDVKMRPNITTLHAFQEAGWEVLTCNVKVARCNHEQTEFIFVLQHDAPEQVEP